MTRATPRTPVSRTSVSRTTGSRTFAARRQKITRVLITTIACTAASLPAASGASAAPFAFWPSCEVAGQTECVESLSYDTGSGVVTVAAPGAPAGDAPTQPYVSVVKTMMPGLGASSAMLNFSVMNPNSATVAAGVSAGVDEGTYTITLRLGSTDPSFVGVQADPVSVTPTAHGDGTFSLTIVAKPKPFVSSMNGYEACQAGGWMCQGDIGTVRNISGFVAEHPTAAVRDAIRGSWVATNASAFSTPQLSLAERKLTTSAAGPHFVPDGYPTDGLVMEGGRGLNPAFYKAFVPFSVLEVMLAKVPAELRTYLTPETIRAKIAEAGASREQPVSVTLTERGVIVDLGLVHFSAPNPEITFLAPTPAGPGTTPGTSSPGTSSPGKAPVKAPRVAVGKKFSPTSYVKVPAGYRVVSVSVKSSSKKVCVASGTKITGKKKGTCAYSVVVAKGKTRRTLSGTTTIG
jgi:hypothetical protein